MREYEIEVSYAPETFCECRKRAQQSIRIRLPLASYFLRGQWEFNTLYVIIVYMESKSRQSWARLLSDAFVLMNLWRQQCSPPFLY